MALNFLSHPPLLCGNPEVMLHFILMTKVALGSGEECGRIGQVNSEMALPNRLELGGMIEGIWENFLVRCRRGGIIHDSLF